MDATYKVVLRHNATPVFPDLCPRCGRKHPDMALRVQARAVSQWFWVSQYAWISWRRPTFRVGVCSGCKPLLGTATLARLWLMCLIAAVALTLTLITLGPLPSLLVLGLVLAWAIFNTWRPPGVRIERRSRSLVFRFARWDYADAFRRGNDSRVKKHNVPERSPISARSAPR